MGTTAAEPRGLRGVGLALLLLVPAGCVSAPRPGIPAAGIPLPAGGDPEVQIGLSVGARSVPIGAGSAIRVSGPDGSHLWMIPPGETWLAAVAGSGFTLASRGWTSGPLEAVTLTPAEPDALIRVNGKAYRGSAVLLSGGTGITAVNRLGMESYLLGVVSAEMGRRGPGDEAALRAQAVVSRTYALRNLGRWRTQGFDLAATVSDQVYGGQGAETPEGRQAVMETQGRVLTYNGAPIDAFFFSTCGGRTADGYEVFRGASRPYLRSIRDEAGSGEVYCRISPRYRWHEEWTGEALRSTLERNLPAPGGGRNVVPQVSNVRVTRRSSSGRVDQLAIGLGGPEIKVEGPTIRQVMRPSSGEPLKSTAFELVATVTHDRVTRLVVDGMGAGHGVGFCQWGAVGRARAGQSYDQILAAYFPGTRLERRY